MPRRSPLALAAALLLALPACDSEPELDEMGAVAEVEPTEGGGVDVDRLWPLEQPDVGESLIANAVVVGTVLPTGFFVRADDRVFFVEGSYPVTTGQAVQVAGQVQPAVVGEFEGWEREAFVGNQLEAQWDIARGFYLDATTVR